MQGSKAAPSGDDRGGGHTAQTGLPPYDVSTAGDGGDGGPRGAATTSTDGAAGGDRPEQTAGTASARRALASGGSAAEGAGKESASLAALSGAAHTGSRCESRQSTAQNGPAGLAAAVEPPAQDATDTGCKLTAGPVVHMTTAQTERDRPQWQKSQTALTTIPGSRQVIAAAPHDAAAVRKGSCSWTELAQNGTTDALAAAGGAVPVWTQPAADSEDALGAEENTAPASTALIRSSPLSKAVMELKHSPAGGAPKQLNQGSNAKGVGAGLSTRVTASPQSAMNGDARGQDAVVEQLDSSSTDDETDGSAASQGQSAGKELADGDDSDGGLACAGVGTGPDLPYAWSQVSTAVFAIRLHLTPPSLHQMQSTPLMVHVMLVS